MSAKKAAVKSEETLKASGGNPTPTESVFTFRRPKHHGHSRWCRKGSLGGGHHEND